MSQGRIVAWLMRPTRANALAAPLSGVLLALAFPDSSLGWLAWVALVPFCVLAFRTRHPWEKVKLFAGFGAGFYLTLLYWFLAMHPLTWLGFSEPQSLIIVVTAWLGASLLLTLQLLVLGMTFGWATRSRTHPGWRHVLALAFGWTAMEWLGSLGPFGFTWGNLALTQHAYLPVIQVLGLVGPFPMAGLIIAFNGAVALTFIRQSGRKLAWLYWRPVGVILIPLALLVGYGTYVLTRPLPETTFSVAIAQGNLAGEEKWSKDENALFRTADKYLELTRRRPEAELVIWPETAVPTFIRNDLRLYERIQDGVRAGKHFLMTGSLDWRGNPPEQKLYNAVTAFGPQGESLGFNYKRHLVPFGEYVPYREYLPNWVERALGLVNIVGRDYTPGNQPHLFEFPFARIGSGICYDGIFPDALRPAVLKGAEVLVLVSNDAWYKDTAAPRVLNAQAVLRAVENRRWVLRAANTGVSSIIEPTGRIVGRTPVFQDATLAGRAAPIRELTVYARYGNWSSALAAFAFLLLLIVQPRRREET